MTGHILWFFDNTFASAATQQDIGPFNPGTVNRIFEVSVHGLLSHESSPVNTPYVVGDDLLWGLQWVAHGAGSQAILTSAPGDQWLWRQNVAYRNDWATTFAPSSATGVLQTAQSLWQDYKGQGNKPGSNIDVYISVQSAFGVTTGPILLLGSIDFLYE